MLCGSAIPTMGIPLLRGRNFTDAELREPRQKILINEALARKYFASEDPIGQRLDVAMFEKPTPAEIIGVVGKRDPLSALRYE